MPLWSTCARSINSFETWTGVPLETNDRPDGVKQVYFQDPDGYWIEVNDGRLGWSNARVKTMTVELNRIDNAFLFETTNDEGLTVLADASPDIGEAARPCAPCSWYLPRWLAARASTSSCC